MGNRIVAKNRGSKVLTDEGLPIDRRLVMGSLSSDLFLAILEIKVLQNVSTLSADGM